MSEWKIKGVVEDTEQKTAQQEEQAVLDQAVEKGDITPEAAGQDTEETPKINLNDLNKEEEPAKEEPPVEEIEEDLADEDSPLELIEDEPEQAEEEVKEEEPVVQEQVEEPVQETPSVNLPENVNKLVEFMEETGGTLEDYVRLNMDLDKLPDGDLLREYYRQSKPWDS